MSNVVQPNRLNLAVETHLHMMNLPEAEENIVAECISRYSYGSVNGFCDLLNWIIFRISNAFAYAVGKQTDWDIAKKVVEDHIVNLAVQEGSIIVNPSDDHIANINEAVLRCISNASSQLLTLSLNFQDLDVSEMNPEEIRRKATSAEFTCQKVVSDCKDIVIENLKLFRAKIQECLHQELLEKFTKGDSLYE